MRRAMTLFVVLLLVLHVLRPGWNSTHLNLGESCLPSNLILFIRYMYTIRTSQKSVLHCGLLQDIYKPILNVGYIPIIERELEIDRFLAIEDKDSRVGRIGVDFL